MSVALVINRGEDENVKHQEGTADGNGDAQSGRVGGQTLLVGLGGVLLHNVG